MELEVIQSLQQAYGPVVWRAGQIAGIPGEGWLYIEASPLPPSREEAVAAAADIILGNPILVLNGKVRHNPDCRLEHTLIPEQFHIAKAIQNLTQKTFKVAVHPGIPGVLFDQPVAVAFDPVIAYNGFPDHPHLNTGGMNQNGIYLPDSFCYSSDIAREFDDTTMRLNHALARITVWLYRHMIWEETRKGGSKGTWIGPVSEETLPAEAFLITLNPDGPCRCRNGKTYRRCHLPKDLAEYRHSMTVCSNELVQRNVANVLNEAGKWRAKQKLHKEMVNRFKKHYKTGSA